jgi:hypothetical protein
MVLDISNNKRVDTVLLERITNEVEKLLSTSKFVPPVTTDNKPNTDQHTVDSGSEHQEQVSGPSVAGRSRESEQLLSLLGNILQQVHNSLKILFYTFYLVKWLMNSQCKSIIFAR